MVFYVLIRGPLRIGKSTVAKHLAGKVEAEYISIDRILDERGLETWYRGYVSQRSFLRANAYAVRRARPFLRKRRPVIFDGNFYYQSQIEDLVGQLDYRHYVFTLKAPLSVCIERDGRRVPPYGSKAAREVYAISTGFDYGIGIDATRPVGRVVNDIITRLSKDSEETPR
jgi:predicted kinase